MGETTPRLRLRTADDVHILSSTGRNDRHTKVRTAKGPRDRRVRLAAHTAIQFYDVQDRLGYDRPSKAVDWLINRAKSAIDDLANLPANEEERRRLGIPRSDLGISAYSGKRAVGEQQRGSSENPNPKNSRFLPPSLDSDAIADTIKSFFPTGGATAAAPNFSAMEFRNFQNPNSQDLRLSLQSVHDPIILHHQNPNPQTQPQQVLLSGTPLGFDGTSAWPDWNSSGDSAAPGYWFNSNQFVSQRGPLQSSNTPATRAWMDPSAMADHHNHQPTAYPSSMFTGGFPSFHGPTQIQGDEGEQDGYSDKPSSASSSD